MREEWLSSYGERPLCVALLHYRQGDSRWDDTPAVVGHMMALLIQGSKRCCEPQI